MTFETNIPLGDAAAALHANNTKEEVGKTGESHHDSHCNNESTELAEEPKLYVRRNYEAAIYNNIKK